LRESGVGAGRGLTSGGALFGLETSLFVFVLSQPESCEVRESAGASGRPSLPVGCHALPCIKETSGT